MLKQGRKFCHLEKVIKVCFNSYRLLRINADDYSTKHLVIFWVLYILLIILISLLTLACKFYFIQYLLLSCPSKTETVLWTLLMTDVQTLLDSIPLELLFVNLCLLQIQLQVSFSKIWLQAINFSSFTSHLLSKTELKLFSVKEF